MNQNGTCYDFFCCLSLLCNQVESLTSPMTNSCPPLGLLEHLLLWRKWSSSIYRYFLLAASDVGGAGMIVFWPLDRQFASWWPLDPQARHWPFAHLQFPCECAGLWQNSQMIEGVEGENECLRGGAGLAMVGGPLITWSNGRFSGLVCNMLLFFFSITCSRPRAALRTLKLHLEEGWIGVRLI